MKITARLLREIIKEEVKRVILESDVHHDTSGLDPEGVERYNELWDVLQNSPDYQSGIADGTIGAMSGWELEDFIRSVTNAYTRIDDVVVERLSQNIVNDLS